MPKLSYITNKEKKKSEDGLDLGQDEVVKSADMAALSPPPADGSSDAASDSRMQLLGKAILALAPTLIGGAFGGAAGGAIGAEAGTKGLSAANEFEKEGKKEAQSKAEFALKSKKEGVEEKYRAAQEARDVKKLALEERKLGQDLAMKETGKPLAAEQADKMAGHISSMKSLEDLESAVSANKNNFGPVAGFVKGLNPYNVEQKSLSALTKTAAQNIGKSLEGGKLTDQDILRYEKMLPSTSDSPDVALAKIAQLKRGVALKQASDLEGYSNAGLNVKNFAKIPVHALDIANKSTEAPGRLDGLDIGATNAQAAPSMPAFHEMSAEELKKYLGR